MTILMQYIPKETRLFDERASYLEKSRLRLTDDFFECFPCGKPWSLPCRDIDRCPSLGIATSPSFAASNHECSETGNHHLITFFQCIGDGTKYCCDCFACCFGCKVSLFCDDIYEICF